MLEYVCEIGMIENVCEVETWEPVRNWNVCNFSSILKTNLLRAVLIKKLEVVIKRSGCAPLL